ncbi:MAG TPA: LysR family transcriptional regulator [Candidatus Binatia bacterium]|nr:LysR family transcriptional regulator [Candidatus Binatia bacterium]
MEMHQIRYFLAVCGTLNFTRAAEQCNVTQPALTRAIQKLEEELGGLLFRRERKLTHMTDLGNLVRPQLEGILKQSDQARTTAQSFLQLKDAPLRLGVMCTIGPVRFVSFLSRFGADHPGIEVSLTESIPDELIGMLMDGSLDVAITTAPEEPNERLDFRKLYEERFVVAFPPGHRYEAMEAVPIKEIAGEAYLSRANCEYYERLENILEQQMVRVEDVFRSEREDWIQIMVMAGMGICFMPEFSAVLPGLMTRPIVDPPVSRTVYLGTVAGRRFSPAVATFIKAIDRYQWPQQAEPVTEIATLPDQRRA